MFKSFYYDRFFKSFYYDKVSNKKKNNNTRLNDFRNIINIIYINVIIR